MRSNSQTEAEGWKASISFVVSGEANRAVGIYGREGVAALRKHFELMQKDRFLYFYLLDEHGKEVLGQKPPRQAVDLALKAERIRPSCHRIQAVTDLRHSG
jgi:hypothetical protein